MSRFLHNPVESTIIDAAEYSHKAIWASQQHRLFESLSLQSVSQWTLKITESIKRQTDAPQKLA